MTGLLNARRVALVALIVVLFALAVAPLLVLAPRASQLANNNAYQDLSAVVESHNGQVGYNALAAKTLATATIMPGANGTVTYAMRDRSGACWSVVVPAGHATVLPALSPVTYCR